MAVLRLQDGAMQKNMSWYLPSIRLLRLDTVLPTLIKDCDQARHGLAQ